jgi:hypothetical protein
MDSSSKSSKNASKNNMNMKMVGAAIAVIVVIIIIAAGAYVLSKGGQHSSGTTTVTNATTSVATNASGSTAPTTAATTAATTTAASNVTSTSFSSWAGQNISLSSFSRQLSEDSYFSQKELNVTYNYKEQLATKGTYAYVGNYTGTTNLALYYNSTRLTTNTTVAGTATTDVSIYNATSRDQYTCTEYSGSFTCYLEASNVTPENSTGLGYIGKENSSVTGYINNIVVTSDSSYNGQPCTLITGHIYIKYTGTNASSTTNGQISSCVANNNNIWLTQALNATITSSASGQTYNSTLNYTEHELSYGTSTSAAITALPGPVSNTVI